MSISDELQKLHELHQKGGITVEEFEIAKERILQLHSPTAKPTVTQVQLIASELTANQWAMWLHISQFAGVIVPIAGLVVPIIIWQLKKDSVPGLDAHGKVIANWLISSFIYGFVCGLLMCVYIGFLFFPILICIGILFPIIGAVKANNGELWNYPLTLRFIS